MNRRTAALSTTLTSFLATPALADTVSDDCTLKGFKLYGDIEVVDSFPDLKVQIVDSFPDLKVEMVDSFPDDCGQWKMVESFPDLKIQYVDSFPDLKIKIVTEFSGSAVAAKIDPSPSGQGNHI